MSETLRQIWARNWTENRPIKANEYTQYLQGLTPERLVDYLQHFQSRSMRGLKTVAAGISVAGLAVLTSETIDKFVRFDTQPTMADTIAVLFFLGGTITTIIGIANTSQNSHTLRFVNREIERRLLKDAPLNIATSELQ